jgi:uncharacterized membrane protein
MNRRGLGLASLLIVAALAAAAAWVAMSLPGDVPLPTHWGLDGEPDRFSDKWSALMMPALIAAGVSLLFYFLPALESRSEGLKRSQGLYLWSWIALLLMSVFIELAVVSTALQWSVHATSFILAGVGLIFILIGNQLGKSRSMYLIGIRTPWTLASEEVWIRTHRLAGKLMVAGGALLVLGAFLPLPSGVIATLMLAVIAIAVIVPVAYSFILWRRERESSQASG